MPTGNRRHYMKEKYMHTFKRKKMVQTCTARQQAQHIPALHLLFHHLNLQSVNNRKEQYSKSSAIRLNGRQKNQPRECYQLKPEISSAFCLATLFSKLVQENTGGQSNFTSLFTPTVFAFVNLSPDQHRNLSKPAAGKIPQQLTVLGRYLPGEGDSSASHTLYGMRLALFML